jgi:biotin carboxylase
LPYSTIFGKGVIPSEIEGRVIQEIQKIIDATKIKNGALNVEFRVSKNGKVNFIEVNSRHSGNYIYKLMNYAYGVSLEEIAVKLALGESLNIDDKKQTGFFAYALIFSKSAGVFEGVSISEEIKPYVKEQFIFKEKGNTVNSFEKLTDRIGILLLEFPSFETMETVTNNFHNYYNVELSQKME